MSEYSISSHHLMQGACFPLHCSIDVVQICIVVERRDRIVNICDVKFCNDEFTVTKEYYRAILRRQNLIAQHIGEKCAIRNTLITTFGLKKNEYGCVYSDVLVLDDLFIP